MDKTAVARSLNEPYDSVIDGLAGQVIIEQTQYIYNPNDQTTWGRPAGVGDGEVIVSVVGDQLKTDVSSPSTYTLITQENSDLRMTLSEATTSTSIKLGDSIRITDRGDGIFDVVMLSANGFNVIAHDTLPITLALRVTGTVNIVQLGAKKDKSADISAIMQFAIDNYPKVYTPDGEYLWSATVNLVGNRQIEFSQGAILRPGASGFAMLKQGPVAPVASNIKIQNMFASDFGGVTTGVTMILAEDIGPGFEIHSPKATQLDTMIDITADSFGAKIYSPTAFKVPFPIKTGGTGSVGTVDVYSPNFDNGIPNAGGTGLGVGISFSASGSVYGGYIQGFDTNL